MKKSSAVLTTIGVLLAVLMFGIYRWPLAPLPPDPLDEPPIPRFGRDAYPDLPIDFFSWKEPDPLYAVTKPENWKPPEVSPALQLSEEILDYQYVRVSKDILILVEKENTPEQVDIFSIIDAETGEKQFFTGSFVVPSRLNLDKEILVYAQGHVLIVEDKEGKLWQLDLMY